MEWPMTVLDDYPVMHGNCHQHRLPCCLEQTSDCLLLLSLPGSMRCLQEQHWPWTQHAVRSCGWGAPQSGGQ